MPSVERTTSGMIDPSSATIQGTIDGLRIPLAIGSVVSAATINSLLAMWRSFNDHYHQTGDLFGDGYGNTGSYAAGANNWDTNPENTSRMGGTEPVERYSPSKAKRRPETLAPGRQSVMGMLHSGVIPIAFAAVKATDDTELG